MKALSALFLLACLTAPLAVRAADAVVPPAVAPEHYKPIWARSPFTVATVVSKESATWILSGLAEEDDAPLVFLVNRQNQERMSITSTPNEKGFSVESVDYNANPLLSTVRVKTPEETLTLHFDTAAMTALPVQTNAPNGPFSGMPGRPGVGPAAMQNRLNGHGPMGNRPNLPPVTRATIPNPIAPANP